jgi:hypothetical protein
LIFARHAVSEGVSGTIVQGSKLAPNTFKHWRDDTVEADYLLSTKPPVVRSSPFQPATMLIVLVVEFELYALIRSGCVIFSIFTRISLEQ